MSESTEPRFRTRKVHRQHDVDRSPMLFPAVPAFRQIKWAELVSKPYSGKELRNRAMRDSAVERLYGWSSRHRCGSRPRWSYPGSGDPHDRIVETRVARQLSIGQPAVREALGTLEETGSFGGISIVVVSWLRFRKRNSVRVPRSHRVEMLCGRTCHQLLG